VRDEELFGLRFAYSRRTVAIFAVADYKFTQLLLLVRTGTATGCGGMVLPVCYCGRDLESRGGSLLIFAFILAATRPPSAVSKAQEIPDCQRVGIQKKS